MGKTAGMIIIAAVLTIAGLVLVLAPAFILAWCTEAILRRLMRR